MKCLEQPSRPKITLPERMRVEFPRGLFGFERVKSYQLAAAPEEGGFLWLEMIGDQAGAFLVARPEEWVGFYEPKITEEDMAMLEIHSAEEALILAVATPQAHGCVTLNLKSPILINLKRGLGKQIIPRNVSSFTSHYPVEILKT